MGKYILIFGNSNGEEYKKFCEQGKYECRFSLEKNANDWTNISHDESGKIITSDLLMMQMHTTDQKNIYFWWKPLLPFHKNFLPDNYTSTTQNFSETNNQNQSGGMRLILKKTK